MKQDLFRFAVKLISLRPPLLKASWVSPRCSGLICVGAMLLFGWAGPAAPAADRFKANNTDDLNQTTSWAGGVVPGGADVAVWDDTVMSANTTVLGADLSWHGIRIEGDVETGLIRINPGHTLSLGSGGIDMSDTVRNLTLNTIVDIQENQSWNVAEDQRLTFINVNDGVFLSGAAELTKTGAGTVRFHNNLLTNSYTGLFTLEEGTLEVIGAFRSSGTGDIVLKHGTRVVNAITATASVTTSATGDAHVTHLEGDVTLVGTTGGLSDSTRLRFASDRSVTNAMNLRTNVEINVENPLNDAGGGYIDVVGFSEEGGSWSLTKTGPGMLLLNRSTSTYTGGTFIKEGILQLGTAGAANRLHSTSPVEIDGGVFSIVGNIGNQSIGDLTLVNGSIEGDSLVSLNAASYLVQSGSIARLIGGASSGLTKTTAGTVEISAEAAYGGATVVEAGTLRVTETGSLNNSSPVTINAGGRFIYNSSVARTGAITLNGNGAANRAILGGTGEFNLALDLNNIGDTLSPGNSPGIMPFTMSQEWTAFTYIWETNNFIGTTAGTDFDQITIDGQLTLTGGIGDYELDIVSLTAANQPGDVENFSEIVRSWRILTTTGGITGFDADHWTLNTANFTSDPDWSGPWLLVQDGNDLMLHYIPEPGAMALLLWTACLWLTRRRVRRT